MRTVALLRNGLCDPGRTAAAPIPSVVKKLKISDWSPQALGFMNNPHYI